MSDESAYGRRQQPPTCMPMRTWRSRSLSSTWIRLAASIACPWVADGKCTGLAIHIGARIAALARPDEILLSEAAKVQAGSSYRFDDRGEASLKGIPGRWHLYAVAAASSG